MPATSAPPVNRVRCATCGRSVPIYVLGGMAVPHKRLGYLGRDGRTALCPDRRVYRS